VQETWKQFISQVVPLWRDTHLRCVLGLTPFPEEACMVSRG
jgi:hypothetical protein